jgi:hypothetical protein
MVRSLNSASINLACHKRFTRKCKFRVILKIVHNFDPNSAGFYHPSNFIVKPSKEPSLEFHTCQGFRSVYEAREGYGRCEPITNPYFC